jgi:preprotein translocase subunit SecB
MTDTPPVPPSSGSTDPVSGEGRSQQNVRFEVMAQYMKDLSFENPNAPRTFQATSEKPQINLSADVRAQRLDENVYECLLHFEVDATVGENKAFMIDLLYAGLFRVEGATEDMLEPLLLIEGPHYIFPFARRILADVTRDGGYPPFMLEPIDWAGLYRQRKSRMETAEGGQQAGNGGGTL